MNKQPNRKLNILSVLLFLVMITVLPLSWYINPASKGSESSENRVLSEIKMPQTKDELFAFPESFSSWYNDHLPYKENLVAVKSELEISVFHELDSDHAILGTVKPWLFYKEPTDGEQIANYKHTNTFTDTQLSEIHAELSRIKDRLSGHGIDLALLIVPDKETIYGPDYMPQYIKVMEARPARTDILTEYLSQNAQDIKVVYPGEQLMAEKYSADTDPKYIETYATDSEQLKAAESSDFLPLYYESDTHWNRIGAKIGFDALLELLNMTDPAYHEILKDISFTETAYEGIPGFAPGDHMWNEGDIQKLCKLPAEYNSREFYPDSLPMALTSMEIFSPGGEVVYQQSVSTSEECIDKKIYFCGDSYRWHMVDYIREGFKESIIVSRYYLDLDDVIAASPDIFVYEIPERYLADLRTLPGVSKDALVITEDYTYADYDR